MFHRDLQSLTEETRKKISELIVRAEAAGVKVFVFETLREDDVQAAYCAQGRESLDQVNAKRQAAGLYLIDEAQNKMKITDEPPMGLKTVYLGRGHGNGTAADLVPLDSKGSLWWGAPLSTWEVIGKIGEELGLEWGGRWKSKDYPHFQLKR